MEIIFTKNNSFWSKVFRFLSSDPVSHIAFVFKVNDNYLTIDCSTSGGRLMTLEKFMSFNFPVYLVNLESNQFIEHVMFKNSLDIVGKKYDKLGYTYAILIGIGIKLFGIKQPNKNLFSSKEKYLCTEIICFIKDILKQEFGISFDGINLDMVSPYQIFKIIEKQRKQNVSYMQN